MVSEDAPWREIPLPVKVSQAVPPPPARPPGILPPTPPPAVLCGSRAGAQRPWAGVGSLLSLVVSQTPQGAEVQEKM